MSDEPGTLYVVATPIGNLEDITLRALRVLGEVDLIAAEDTRHTRKLLNAHGISRPLLSYHEHNMRTRGYRLIRELLGGKSVALVTDAGTPTISDPGLDLVNLAASENIPVRPIPGPSAVTTALAVSGFPVQYFIFLGYPPNRPPARRKFFSNYANVEHTLVLFESPRRLGSSLKDMRKIWGNRRVTVARELTKIHEEIFRGSLDEAIVRWPREARGEITLLVGGAQSLGPRPDDSLLQQLRLCLTSNRRPLKEIAAELAQERGLSKRLVYQQALKIKKELKRHGA
ncbi:MAG: 16S rRNA (cytidine(1402)-2'-O)-methyltransferase [Deltaproteobacteria bacterium]|jgi:16S rRNA (cytidine1402-2'-O)-methyltransferase